MSTLASWSPWLAFDAATLAAPREPGVYLARQNAGELVYVGRAGERQGRGINGRLSVYRAGKAAVSGLGEAALDRALADPAFVQQHLDELKAADNRDAGRASKNWITGGEKRHPSTLPARIEQLVQAGLRMEGHRD